MVGTTTTLTSLPAGDCLRAILTLPDPVVTCQGSVFLAKISADWYCIVTLDDGSYPAWAFDAIPPDHDWAVSFESMGAAMLVHFTPYPR